jgi:hypothetical protein
LNTYSAVTELSDDCFISQAVDVNYVASPLMDVERNLAFLLGLHAHWLSQSTALQPAEEEAQQWLHAVFLRGGLQVLQPPNPYEEEKGEARSTSSTAGTTPTEPKTPKLEGLHKWTLDRAVPFLQALAEHRSAVWFSKVQEVTLFFGLLYILCLFVYKKTGR